MKNNEEIEEIIKDFREKYKIAYKGVLPNEWYETFLRQKLTDRDSYWLKKIEEGLGGRSPYSVQGLSSAGGPYEDIDEAHAHNDGWDNCLAEIKKRLLK